MTAEILAFGAVCAAIVSVLILVGFMVKYGDNQGAMRVANERRDVGIAENKAAIILLSAEMRAVESRMNAKVDGNATLIGAKLDALGVSLGNVREQLGILVGRRIGDDHG